MKKLLLSAIIVLLFACQKDKNCWICETITTSEVLSSNPNSQIPAGKYPNTQMKSEMLYNMYSDQIRDYESDHASIDTLKFVPPGDTAGYSILVKAKMHCSLK